MNMPALEITNLNKTYASGKVALKNINLTVPEGDFFALLGQNGAGKSTTIGIISSLIKKTSGTINVFGYDIDHDPKHAKSLIGIVPQEMNFSTFEKASQILLNQAGYFGIPYKIAKERMNRYLNAMGIWHARNDQVVKLSGGMKRRLLITRALMNEPKLLILDEPTAGVDFELRHTLWDFLRTRNETGTTIILTTHYLEEAEQLCKNVGIIHQGEIIVREALQQLVSKINRQTLILTLVESPPAKFSLLNFDVKKIDTHTLEVSLKPTQTISELFVVLNESGIHVKHVMNKTNRLEEVFISAIQ